MADEIRDPFNGAPLGHRRTREDWLLDAFEAIRPWFEAIGHKLPEMIRISVGFRDGAKQESRIVIGCAYPGPWAKDGVYQVFISPVTDDPVEVLDTLVHELAHVILECRHGHGYPFKKIAKAIGLTGRMDETVAGPELRDRLDLLAIELGDYPHSALTVPVHSKIPTPVGGDEGGPLLVDPRPSGPKRQRNHQLKVVCTEMDCPAALDGKPYMVRTTQRWLDVGAPRCPAGHEMEQLEW